MNTKQLRQKILDLAIKGKLVPQDPNDEPASKLLERIRAEKERLIKDGKIKRDKNESYIFVGDDKLHYEKFADGSVVCIEEEIPFEIPESWAWCRLKNVGTAKIGLTYKPTDVCNCGIPVLRSNNIKEDKLNLNELIYVNCNVNDNLLVKDNDILICARNGSKHLVGKSALIKKNENRMTFGAFMSIFRSYCNNYVFRFLNSNYFRTTMADANSTQINQLTQDMIKETLCPLPPLSEQQRISGTVETLLELVDSIDSNKTDLADLITQTKSKVLDLAIKGKLVSQDPNDESADKLLERIREEKEKLIKEGKLKRDKNETYIFKNSDDNSYYEKIGKETVCIDDDLPFEIPDSWRWTKFCNICDIARGGSPRPIEKYITNDADGINWIKIGDTEKGGKYIYSTKEKIKREGIAKSRYVKPGDFLLTNSMSFGRPYILKIDGCIHDGWLVINDNFRVFDQDFLYYLLSSNVMYQLLSIAAKGSTVKNLKSDTVKIVIMPVPPKNEQILISKKIESIFTQLDIIQEIFLQ